MDLPARWRPQFPGLERSTYLNNCAHGALARPVDAAVRGFLDAWRDEGPSWPRYLEHVEAARRSFADLIGARVEEVSVQANASTGISALLSAFPTAPDRREIVTTDLDFPTEPFIAAQQQRRGLRHTHLRSSPAPLSPAALANHVTPQTGLVTLPHVASFSGARLDSRSLISVAHARGAPVLLDVFQAMGTMPLDVHALDVDFLVSGVYKWLLGTAGIAFLYVRRDWHDNLRPTALGWYAAEDPVGPPDGPLAPDARRFQFGGPSVVSACAARAGMDLVREVGPGAIEAHNQALGDMLLAGARERGWKSLTPEAKPQRGSIINLQVPRLQEALAACEREGVVVNERLGGIRVSPHFYNTRAEVGRFFEVVDAAAR